MNKNMEIARKAFRVYHDGMLSEHPYEGYRIDELPVVYADTPGEAKSNSSEVHDFELNGRAHEFTDLKVFRAKESDEVWHEGNIMKRKREEIR